MDDTDSGATAPIPPQAPPPPAPPAGPPLPPPFASGLPGQPGQLGQPGPNQPGQPGQPGSRPQDRFFDGIRRIGLHRSQHRVVGGVSAGIAERTGIDVTVVRVLTVVLAIFGGLGVLAYGLAWLFLPEPDGRIHAEQVLRGDLSAGAIGAIATTVLSLGSSGGLWNHGPVNIGWHGGGIWGVFWGLSGTALFIGAVAFVIYLVTRGRNAPPSGPVPPGGFGSPYVGPTPYAGGPGPSTPPTAPAGAPPAPPYGGTYAAPYGAGSGSGSGVGSGVGSGSGYGAGAATMTAPPMPPVVPTPAPTTPVRLGQPRRRSFGAFGALVVAGLAVVGAAVTGLVMSNGDYTASTAVMAWAVALGVIALSLVVGGLAGRRAGIVGLFAVVAVVGTLLSTVVPKLNHLQGAGDRTWRPATVTAATDGYGLGAGDATLDLSSIDRTSLSSADPATVSVSVGVGQLTVLVPTGVSVEVRSSVGAGDIARVTGFDQLPLTQDSNAGVFVDNGRDAGHLSGLGVHRTIVTGPGPVQLVVEAKVGLGEIHVEEL